MQHTTNYNLNQWEDADRVSRADFNADNAKIDAALKAVADAVSAAPKIALGSFVGTGGCGYNNRMTLTFDFEPKAVFLSDASLTNTVGWLRGMNTGASTNDAMGGTAWLTWNGNTLRWHANSETEQFNSLGERHYYLAIG